MCCSSIHSKRAASRFVEVSVLVNKDIVITKDRFTGDIAILNRGWASVVSSEHISNEIQTICEIETQTKRTYS
jgi:hypothetical protein